LLEQAFGLLFAPIDLVYNRASGFEALRCSE